MERERGRGGSHLGAVSVAVSVGVVEQCSTQTFSQKLPVVS